MSSTIFGLFRQTNGEDPLASGNSLGDWLARQPGNDFLALQEAIVRLLEDQAARQPKITANRVLAVMDLDRVAAGLHARLLRQSLQPSLSDAVRLRLWHAADDVARWFAYSYEQMFEDLQDRFLSPKAKGMLPGAAARMFHYRGVQALQGLFHYERWIPRRWNVLHAAYAATAVCGCARVPFGLFADRPAAESFSAEEEFLQILLMQRVNTGNLAAFQTDLAATWLRAWVHGLALASAPLEGPGFWLDLGQGEGLLARKPEKPLGTLLYLDVAPLLARIDNAQVELSVNLRATGAKAIEAEGTVRLQLLNRLREMWSVATLQKARRGERIGTDRPVDIAVGLARVTMLLRGPVPASRPAPARQPALATAGGASPRESHDHQDHEVIDFHPTEPHGWRMYDYSESGCRLVSSAAAGAAHRLGALVAVREPGDTRCKVAVIRRLKKFSGGRAELGVEVIAQHAVLITPRPATGRDSGYSVDGIDVSIEGKTFDGLYLPPTQSELHGPQRTMIVPAAEYSEGRRCALSHDGVGYIVEFNAAIESNKEWAWTTFEVISNTE